MLSIRDTLMWYKRLDVRRAMLAGAVKKEIGTRYTDSFGKRPDALDYEQDILDMVQQGATSFHASEELWSNPRSIDVSMDKKQIAELRIGWDLVFDIDFTNFEATKIITHALCMELEKHGIHHYGVKFSGNKGFHIGVAWESFPHELNTISVASLFPEAARQIADYLVFSLDNPDNNFRLSEQLRTVMTEEASREHTKSVCAKCGRDKKHKKYEQHFVCGRCGHIDVKPAEFENYLECSVCKSFMERVVHETDTSTECVCGSVTVRDKIDLKIDTQLISSRHLYRLEYSLHEKSGLVSMPLPNNHILTFQRDEAKPELIKEFPDFWNRTALGEATQLFIRSQAFSVPEDKVEQAEVIWDMDSAPEDMFPPCMKIILAGIKDGKKRSAFILINFLQSVGWNKDMIEKRLGEWNAKNPEPLREVTLKGSLRYHIGKKVLPPNCDNKAYYLDFAVCKPDQLCSRIKNPVQYVKLKMRQKGVKQKTSDKSPAASTSNS